MDDSTLVHDYRTSCVQSPRGKSGKPHESKHTREQNQYGSVRDNFAVDRQRITNQFFTRLFLNL